MIHGSGVLEICLAMYLCMRATVRDIRSRKSPISLHMASYEIRSTTVPESGVPSIVPRLIIMRLTRVQWG